MKRILANDTIAESAVKAIENLGYEVVHHHYDKEELKEEIKNFDGMIVRSGTKVRNDLIDAAKETGRLKLIVRAGVGLDNINVNYAEENGITVHNTPNASSSSVAELTIAHIFALARHLHISNVTMRNGEWNKKLYKGIEINGKELGLIGFGRISREVAKKANALGMNVSYFDICGKDESVDYAEYKEFEELLSNSDFISLHIPYIKEKGSTINKKEIELMKDGVYLVNVARGGVVCEEALLDALDSGKIAAAAVDVFIEEPTKNEDLHTHDKVSLTPHIGASTHEAQTRIGEEIFDVVNNFFNK